MTRRLRLHSRWLALLLILSIGVGCSGPATPTPAPTSASSPALSDGVLYQDDFTNPASGWPVEATDKSQVGYHPPDVYHVEVSAPSSQQVVFLPNRTFDDVTVGTDVKADHLSSSTSTGDFRYGLALRGTGDRYYAFTVSPRTQTWQVIKSSSAGVQVLEQGTTDSIQGLKANDTLRVDASGADFTFYINGDQAITRIHDSDYASGGVGFFVQTLDEPLAHIHFDSLTIHKVELEKGVLFRDDFTNPASGWPVEVTSDSKIGYHPPAVYHVEVNAPNGRRTVFVPNKSFGDATAETDVKVDHLSSPTSTGDFRYGLALRGTDDRYYAFAISPRTKTWQVIKSSSTGLKVLAQGTADSIQGLTANDKLRVDASGANFTFVVNGQTVARVNDSDYPNGGIGFFVQTVDEPLAHIHYASLTIRTVELATGVLFQDDFTNPASGWPVEATDKSQVGYHPPDVYHVEVSAPSSQRVVFLPNRTFDDVTVGTDVKADHLSSSTSTGDFRYGLALRGTGDRYYAFTVSPRTQTWQVIKSSSAGMQVLEQGTTDSIQGLKANDTLRVDASGADFTFYINGDQAITRIHDSDYASGGVGFFVQTLDEPLAHIHFDSLTIREVESVAIAAVPTPSPAPTATPMPPTSTPTPIPAPQGMGLIPAGYFQMGSANGQANEAPVHPVLLDAFYIDQFEVTNAQYRACVSDGKCTRANSRNSFTHAGYRDDPAYDNYPVIGVTWDQSSAYCGWVGGRLPTEAEWEYAARGPDSLVWPWGDTFDPGKLPAAVRDVQPVGSYPAGASPFGVFDMAGNVAEWVADVYDSAFYAGSPASNPKNAGDGAARIYHGGAFDNLDGAAYTTSHRYTKPRTFNDVDVGFRCARDATEVNGSASPEEHKAVVAKFCQAYGAYKPGAPCP